MALSPVYRSPLCDTSEVAYLRYLESLDVVFNKFEDASFRGSFSLGWEGGSAGYQLQFGVGVDGVERGVTKSESVEVGCGRCGDVGTDVSRVLEERNAWVGASVGGRVESAVVSGGSDCGGDAAGAASVSGDVGRSNGSSRKKEKKQKREKERKMRREMEKLDDVKSEVLSDGGCEPVRVPEWRRKVKKEQPWKRKDWKSVEVCRREERMRLSKFAGCDEVVRKELLESQAKRYIAENNAAIVKANEQARRVAASLKAGVPERNVEVQRLQLDKRMNKFAEEYMKDDDGVSRVKTVLSEGLEDIIAVPVMSEGSSVSPDSSISVAQVNKMIKLIHGQASENEELRKAMGKLGIDDSGIASATLVEPALTGYGFFPAEDDLAHQLEFYSDY